jgi:D-alanine transaminase
MSRIAYVNGRYTRHADATVHIEDRGMQFSDGVYEVIAVVKGHLVDRDLHQLRLERSLGELKIALPMSRLALFSILAETVRRNRVVDGFVYLQVGRGVAPRNHAFPHNTIPSVVVTARRVPPGKATVLADGVQVVTVPDQRWTRRDIKSVSLLANVLAKQDAAKVDAFEAWQIDSSGYVTEGAQSNAWIVEQDGTIVTRAESNDILSGITRHRLILLAREAGLKVEERSFTPEDAKAAREAFLTGTSSFVVPIVRIDDETIGNGRPGSITERLSALYSVFAGRSNAA